MSQRLVCMPQPQITQIPCTIAMQYNGTPVSVFAFEPEVAMAKSEGGSP